MQTFEFMVNGYLTKASYSKEFVAQARRLIDAWWSKAEDSGQRVVVFLAAPPGAGKSTLALLFEELSKEKGKRVQALGMDGFHHYQRYILTHTVARDGKVLPMKEVKGCPESFDFDRLQTFVKRLKQEEHLKWPLYDRRKHDVVDDQIEVSSPVVLLEGNYLLLEETPWNTLKQYCDLSIFLSVKEEEVRTRLIQRKLMGGLLPHEAVAFCEQSDLVNVRRVLGHRMPADITILLEDGEYKISEG